MFYKKASKFLRLEDSKEALCKVEGEVANKTNDSGEVPYSNKSKDKIRGEDKSAKSLKKQKSWPVENKGTSPKMHQLSFPHCSSRTHLRGDR